MACRAIVTLPNRMPDELLDEFVMVAGDVNDLGLLAAFAQQLLDEHVVVVAPEPAELQFPAVNEIADHVKVFAVHHAQEIQQLAHAGVARAQMDVRNPDRAAGERLVQIQFQHLLLVLAHTLMTTTLCCNSARNGNR